MNNAYNILNDIETDLSGFDEEMLSETEIKRINKRLKSRIAPHSGYSRTKALSVMGKAAILVIGFMAVGGGVYAASQYRKNLKDDMRVRATDTRVISEDGNSVTKEMFDDVTGAYATYEVTYEDASDNGRSSEAGMVERIVKEGIADAEITGISMDENNMKIGVRFTFDDPKDPETIKKRLDDTSAQGASWNSTEVTGISLETKLDDIAFFNWGNKYSVEGNSLYLDLFMDTTMTMAYMDEMERRYEERAAYLREHPEEAEAGIFDGPETEATATAEDEYAYSSSEPDDTSLREELIAARMQEFEEYKNGLPDPLSSAIKVIIDLGEEYGGTYTFTTRLEGEFGEGSHERIAVNGGSAKLDLDGIYQELDIKAYSVGGTGLKLYGDSCDGTDWNVYVNACDEKNIEFSGCLRIRAWDDLGNTYLMLWHTVPGDRSKKTTSYGEAEVQGFVAEIYDNAFGLKQFGEEAGINYSSEWADGITQISFAIEKEVVVAGADRINHATVELVSEPVTITLQ